MSGCFHLQFSTPPKMPWEYFDTVSMLALQFSETTKAIFQSFMATFLPNGNNVLFGFFFLSLSNV